MRRRGRRRRLDHPRIRGEHLRSSSAPSGMTGSSPHTRGARRPARRASASARIIPAYAGSTGAQKPFLLAFPDHPRIRGEHTIPASGGTRKPGSSPHTRGAQRAAPAKGKLHGIIPAYAGSTRCTSSLLPSWHGSSPHTRGAQTPSWKVTGNPGIIPAYAGSTTSSPPPAAGRGDHPRIRGEHSMPATGRLAIAGSSPHTRGAPPSTGNVLPRPGIIPAYAGSTLGNPCNTKDRRRDYTSFPLPVTHPSGGGGS